MNNSSLSYTQEFKREWPVLVACFCGVAGGIASISFYTSGIFIIPIEQEFVWSRTAISAQALFGVLLLVIGSPFIGRIIDKIGVRTVAVFSLAAYAACLFAASYFVVSLWSFYLIAIITALVAIGSSPLTFTRVITGWFDSARWSGARNIPDGYRHCGRFGPAVANRFCC
ncbi:MAG: MFS family permease [Arenicella sp.]|jgi:MFS family permease